MALRNVGLYCDFYRRSILNSNGISYESRLAFVQRLIAYGPLFATTLILIIQTFFSSALASLPITATSAILASNIIFLVWHVETNLIKSSRSVELLDRRINALEVTQKAFINSTTSLSQMKLGAAFSVIAAGTQRVGHLRIYAISSQQILSFLKFNDISIEKCHILLRGFEHDDTAHQNFLNQIRLVCADWQYLHRTKRILELEIRHYDFFPTEYEVIFDNEYLILGLYDSDPEDYSEVSVRDPILIYSTSDSGRIMISEFANRFDSLFETCATHHGPCTIDVPSNEGSQK